MKKFRVAVLVIAIALLLPTSVFASPWRYVGEEQLYYNGYETSIYPSNGNNYKICRDAFAGPAGKVKVELWEHDTFNYNDYVGTRYIARGECGYFWGIDAFVDGTGGAEFFAISKSNSSFHLMFYD